MALTLLVLLVASCVPVSRASGTAPAVAQTAAAPISEGELEAQYGVRVNLLAVTAVGGLVDLRLKILDASKAQGLLQGQVPTLQVEGSGVALTAPEESRPDVRQLQDDGGVFILYPNINTAVKRGDKVTVVFGDIRLEPVVAQ